MVKTTEITVLAWNLKDGLSDPRRADQIAERIAEIDPDIAVFSEGATEGNPVRSSAKRILEEHVGVVHQADYNDADDRKDRHRLVAVAKPDFGEPMVLPNFGRNGFYFSPAGLPVKIAGLHGYDRAQDDVGMSDEWRRRQIRHVLSRMALDLDSQALILGDLSSMYYRQLRALILRNAAPMFDLLPYKNPGEPHTMFERAGNVSQRLAQMALGGMMEELNRANFVDADFHHKSTMKLGPVGVQLDHIMGKRVELSGFEQHEASGLTDHKGVSSRATIFMRQGDFE